MHNLADANKFLFRIHIFETLLKMQYCLKNDLQFAVKIDLTLKVDFIDELSFSYLRYKFLSCYHTYNSIIPLTLFICSFILCTSI